MALGFVFTEVPGATPKNPFSGLIALKLPCWSNFIQAMSSPTHSAFQPGSVGFIMARLVFPQALGKAAAKYFFRPSGLVTPRIWRRQTPPEAPPPFLRQERFLSASAHCVPRGPPRLAPQPLCLQVAKQIFRVTRSKGSVLVQRRWRPFRRGLRGSVNNYGWTFHVCPWGTLGLGRWTG